MKLVADENIAKLIVERLRQEGHEVVYIAELSPSIVDNEVLAVANQGEAILLTDDKDFGDMIYRQHQQAVGIIFLRLAKLSNGAKADTLLRVIAQYAAKLPGAFTTVTLGSVRIRRTP